MMRFYIIAADSMNPLRPTFKNVPNTNMRAGLEVIDEGTLPSADELLGIFAGCAEIARDGKAPPEKEPEHVERPPERLPAKRVGELGLGDNMLDNAISPEDKAQFDERNPPPPDPSEIPQFDEDDLPF